MIFGMTIFTFVHVVISLVAIAAGCVLVYGLLSGKRLDLWTVIFLSTTILTSVTGFFLPFERFLPSHAIGILSLIVLAIAILARYGRHLARRWRATYVVCVVIAFYFNVFVLVVQLFQKVPALKAVAPTQTELPFILTQSAVLVLFIAIAIRGIRARMEPVRTVTGN
jgi:K+-transporting ATPase A subunit